MSCGITICNLPSQFAQAKPMGKPSRKVASHLGKYLPPGLSFLPCNVLSFSSSLTHTHYPLYLAFGSCTHPWPLRLASMKSFSHILMLEPTCGLFSRPMSQCSSTPPTHICPAPDLPTLLQYPCTSYLGLTPFPTQESTHLGLWLPRWPSLNDVVTKYHALWPHPLAAAILIPTAVITWGLSVPICPGSGKLQMIFPTESYTERDSWEMTICSSDF